MLSERQVAELDRVSRNELYREIIEGFIGAYNRFDVEGMLLNVDPAVVFENKSGERVDLHTEGVDELRNQAEDSRRSFLRRKQVITSMKFRDDVVEVDIEFTGTLAIDLPGGMKSGDRVELKGKSVYKFRGEKIIGITDNT